LQVANESKTYYPPRIIKELIHLLKQTEVLFRGDNFSLDRKDEELVRVGGIENNIEIGMPPSQLSQFVSLAWKKTTAPNHRFTMGG
jgi:hypothetical protein